MTNPIRSLGVGSGLDLSALVDGLVNAQRLPAETRLNSSENQIKAEISAFGNIKSKLSSFRSSLDALNSADTFNSKTATLSNSDLFSASAEATAQTGSYSIEVDQLAKAQSLVTNATTAFSAEDDVIGEGTLTINFGTTTTSPSYSFTQDPSKSSVNITVSAANGNNTLSGFASFINDGDYGFNAAVVNDGNGFRLVLTSDSTGANNSLELTVTGDTDSNDTDNAGLSQLAFNASAQGSLSQSVAAQDAALSINGLDVTRETNAIDDLVTGLTLNLTKSEPGTTVQLDVADDSSTVVSAVEKFVNQYNSLRSTINDLGSFDPESEQAGALNGDSTLRNLSNRLRTLLANSYGADSSQTLAGVGITSSVDGTLTLNKTTLEEALSEDASSVQALFGVSATTTDAGIQFVSGTADTQAGTYAINLTTFGGGATVAGSIGGIDGIGDGNQLSVLSGDVQGLTVNVLNGSTGDRGEITVALGLAAVLDDILEDYLQTDGFIEAREDGLNSSLQDISSQREALDLRLESLEARLVSQFSALDTLVAQFTSTSSFLTAQLSNLPGPNNNN